MTSFVTLEQAEQFGFTGSQTALDAATARVQGELGGFLIEAADYKQFEYGPFVQLSRPRLIEVTGVECSNSNMPLSYRVLPHSTVQVGTAGPVTVTYRAGYELEDMPDSVVELITSVARRVQTVLDSVGTPAEAGFTSEATGGESVSMGGIAFSARGGLTDAERSRVHRLFGKRRSRTHYTRF